MAKAVQPSMPASLRLLPSGWWEGVPEAFRKHFQRKTLRQGYYLHLDGCVRGLVFFRRTYGAAIVEGKGEFTCLYRHDPDARKPLQGDCICDCGLATVRHGCAHQAALLFRVFSNPAGGLRTQGKPLGEEYRASFWAHLALCLCRSHPEASPAVSPREGRTVLSGAGNIPFLEIRPGEGESDEDYAQYLPGGWQASRESNTFAGWAAREITAEDAQILKTLGHAPSKRAEFGPAGEMCRRGYLLCPEPMGRLDWDERLRLFRIHLHGKDSPFRAAGTLAPDQAYSLHKKYPRMELGEGFGGEEESWSRGLEFRVVEGSRLRIRPFAQGKARVYAAAEDESPRFGDMQYLPGFGFRRLQGAPGSLLQRYTGWKTYWVEAAAVPDFLRKHGEELAASPHYDLDPLLANPRPASVQSLTVRVHARENSLYRVSLEYRIGATTLDLGLLKSMSDSGRSCLITSAGWVDFSALEWSWPGQLKPENWLPRKTEMHVLMDASLLSRVCVLHAPRTVAVEAEGIAGLGFLPALADEGGKGLEAVVPDGTVPAEGLRPYQAEGARWLCRLAALGLSGILADDMGLGKTHQVMALFAWLHGRSRGRDKILVICPTSVLYHWKEKIDRFHKDLDAGVFHGAQRDPEMLDKEVCITSYGVARNDMALFRRRAYALLVLDEIQYSKNRDSETHQSLRGFPARSIIGLTGTPLENNAWEVKNLFDLILPGYFPAESRYRRDIAEPLESGTDVEQAKSAFLRLTRPFLLRRLKAQVLRDLPGKVEETCSCELAPDQAALYQACLRQEGGPLLRELLDTGRAPLLHVFQLLNRLKQICNHPMTLSGAAAPARECGSGKWELFLFLLEKSLSAGRKVVVFSQYLGMLEWIENHLEKSGIGYAVLTGATRDRRAVLRRFAGDPYCRVFCCSLKAGGVGIDLTAAETVIHYDRWWNAARENQATDRVHRIGQAKNVQVFKLVTRGTIEERIDAIIRKKADWTDALLPGDAEGGLKLFTREELIELLGGGGGFDAG